MYKNRKRLQKIKLSFFLIFLALSARIYYLTCFNSLALKTMTDNQYTYKEKSSELNFQLLDRNGVDLLNYKNIYYVIIDPLVFTRNIDEMDMSTIYSLDYTLKNYNDGYNLPNAAATTQKIYYTVDEDTYYKIKDIKGLRGVYCYTFNAVDRSQTWKLENMLTNIKKNDGSSQKSADSLEMEIWNEVKANSESYKEFKSEINGSISSEATSIPQNNENVKLTIDKKIEDKINEVINKDAYKNKKQIAAILTDPSNGKIIAMTQKDFSEKNIILGGIGNGFTPGSIFKVIVEEAALKSGKIDFNHKYSCTGKFENEGGTHGTLTPDEALMVSCNDIFSQIGNKLGYKTLLDMANMNGLLLNQKVLNMDEEETGYFHVPQPATGDIKLFSIGQSMNITPLQAASITATVINGGVYNKPYVLDSFVNEGDQNIKQFSTDSHRAFSLSIADKLKSDMVSIVNNPAGTGAGAKIDGMEIGGKTGTSTRVEPSPSSPKKMETHSDGWFAGFFKINGKYYSMVVFVKDIDTKNEYAAGTAVPIFKDIVLNIKNMF